MHSRQFFVALARTRLRLAQCGFEPLHLRDHRDDVALKQFLGSNEPARTAAEDEALPEFSLLLG